MQQTRPLTPLGYAQVTVSNSAVGLGTIPRGAIFATIRASNNDVRYRDDGVAPTATVGVPLKGSAGEVLNYDGALAALQFIRSGAADGTLDVAYYGH